MKQVYPEPTVGALIFNKNGKLLLVKSHKWFDKFTIPGGHIELGETMEQALKREVKEEVGLDIKVIDLLDTQEAVFSGEFWKRKQFIFLDFYCTCDNDEITLDKNEIHKFVWTEPKEALKMKLSSFTRRALEEYLKKFSK